MTNGKSPMSFPMNLRWTAYVSPNPKGDNFFVFRIKNGLRSKKVCCKVSLCENCQRQCSAFIGLSIRAEMVSGGCSLLPEIFHQSDPARLKTAISTVWFDVGGPAYLRLVYHIHSTPVGHMCQCNTYFLALTSNSREKFLSSLSIYSLSPMRL